MLVFNLYAIPISVLSVGSAWLLGHATGWEMTRSLDHRVLYAGATFAIAFDFALRSFNWKRIAIRSTEPTILTRNGPVIPKRNAIMEFLEALIGPRSGATFFFAMPAWVIGVIIIVMLRNKYL